MAGQHVDKPSKSLKGRQRSLRVVVVLFAVVLGALSHVSRESSIVKMMPVRNLGPNATDRRPSSASVAPEERLARLQQEVAEVERDLKLSAGNQSQAAAATELKHRLHDFQNQAVTPITDAAAASGVISSSRRKDYYDKVILLGQFNYGNVNPAVIAGWVVKWQQVFKRVQVRGPFKNVTALHELGIDAHVAGDDAGWVSPMKNMADALLLASSSWNQEPILGVLQVHDDLMVNLTHLEALGFPYTSNQILSQALPSVTEKPMLHFSTEQPARCRHNSQDEWRPSSEWPRNGWRWWQHCMEAFGNAATLDPYRAKRYVERDTNTIPFWANALGDFSYVPLTLTKPFADMADWLTDHRVFLECGTPTLHSYLQQSYNATVQFVHYCSVDGKRRRADYTKWIPNQDCDESIYFPQRMKAEPPFGIYHPVKINQHGPHVWKEYFDRIVLGKPTNHPWPTHSSTTS